jgi:GNAT superfamily N-acetyltransferase
VTRIVDLAAADTHDLRRRILRNGTPSTDVVWDGDDDPTTFHLGVAADGRIVSVSTWIERRYPDRPAATGFQLRGMATEPDRRGTGVSTELLHEGVRRCQDRGATIVWARARCAALSFYERHGFTPIGPVYTDLTTGLDHRDILVLL